MSMLTKVGMILSAVTVLLIATKSLCTSQDETINQCQIDAELRIASQIIENVRMKLSGDNAYSRSESSLQNCAVPEIEDAPNICATGLVDAVTRTADGTTYFFKDEFYWKLWENAHSNIGLKRPGIILEDWDGLPGNLDAALTLENGTTFFFKGPLYWKFHNKIQEKGNPHLISESFPGVPDSPDAAFVWAGDHSIYFLKDTEFFRLSQEGVLLDRAKPISSIKRLPSNVDAAFQWQNGQVYIFKEDVYYRLDHNNLEVYTGYHYPSLTTQEWYHCNDV